MNVEIFKTSCNTIAFRGDGMPENKYFILYLYKKIFDDNSSKWVIRSSGNAVFLNDLEIKEITLAEASEILKENADVLKMLMEDFVTVSNLTKSFSVFWEDSPVAWKGFYVGEKSVVIMNLGYLLHTTPEAVILTKDEYQKVVEASDRMATYFEHSKIKKITAVSHVVKAKKKQELDVAIKVSEFFKRYEFGEQYLFRIVLGDDPCSVYMISDGSSYVKFVSSDHALRTRVPPEKKIEVNEIAERLNFAEDEFLLFINDLKEIVSCGIELSVPTCVFRDMKWMDILSIPGKVLDVGDETFYLNKDDKAALVDIKSSRVFEIIERANSFIYRKNLDIQAHLMCGVKIQGGIEE